MFVAGIRGQQLVEKRHGDIMFGELTGEVEAFLVGEREMTREKIDEEPAPARPRRGSLPCAAPLRDDDSLSALF